MRNPVLKTARRWYYRQKILDWLKAMESPFYNAINFNVLEISCTTFHINDNHREKLCFTQLSTKIYWNRSLAASYLFPMLTIPLLHIKQYRCFDSSNRQKTNDCSFSNFYDKIWVGFCLKTGKPFFSEISF